MKQKIKQKVKQVIKPLLIFLLPVSFLFQSISPVLAATFTAGSAKRDAPGPFTAVLVVQKI